MSEIDKEKPKMKSPERSGTPKGGRPDSCSGSDSNQPFFKVVKYDDSRMRKHVRDGISHD